MDHLERSIRGSAEIIDRLQERLTNGSLVIPGQEKADIVDLVRVIARALGVGSFDIRPSADWITACIGDRAHIVFVLMDGLGMNVVERMPVDSTIASNLRGELLSVVPSTTASALASLGTAVHPAEHAVPGWFTYLPDFGVSTIILPFLERYTEVPLQERGILGSHVFTQPSWIGHIPGGAATIHPQRYADGVFARFARGSAQGLGYETMRHAFDIVIDHVKAAGEGSYTFLYLPHLDTVSHVVGPMHDEAISMAHTLDAELARLASLLGDDTRIIVSADHGQILVPHDNQIEIFDGDPLLEILEVPPTGEGRFPLFHLSEENREPFETMFAERFDDRFVLLTIEEIERMGLLGPGPMTRLAKARFGQYAAIPLEDHTLTYLPPSIPPRSSPIGRHGALSRAEMLVPLIVV
jgi:hypothetical protein